MVLCTPSLEVDVKRYKSLRYGIWNKQIKKLPPFRLTYMEPRRKNVQKRYQPFQDIQMCTTIPEPELTLGFDWGEVDAQDTLLMYFSFDSNEPFIRRISKDGKPIKVTFSRKMDRYIIVFSPINVFQYYTGPGSGYSREYPSHIKPYRKTYSWAHCQDVDYIQGHPCGDQFDHLLQSSLVNASQSSFFRRVTEAGCQMTQSPTTIKCDCETAGKTNWTATDQCQPDYLNINYIVSPEIVETVDNWKATSENYTQLLIKQSVVEFLNITQSHALGLIDVFGQIGGYLGLLIGASAITLVEFFEYVMTAIIRPLFGRVTPVTASARKTAFN